MSGESDLKTLLQTLDPELTPETYVFAKVDDLSGDLSWVEVMVREAEGITVVTSERTAAEQGLKGTFPCRKITLRVHSSLEAVGMIAAISSALTKADIGTNPVAGYYHDHLFVPADKADQAMSVLRELSAGDGGV